MPPQSIDFGNNRKYPQYHLHPTNTIGNATGQTEDNSRHRLSLNNPHALWPIGVRSGTAPIAPAEFFYVNSLPACVVLLSFVFLLILKFITINAKIKFFLTDFIPLLAK